MRSKLFAILLSSALSVMLLHGIDHVSCLIRTCETDDASIMASALFGILPLIAYIAFSWILVFPSMLLVRRRLGFLGTSFSISLIFSLVLTWLFHSPAIDSSFFNTAQYLLPWFVLPWFLGGLVALAVWPNPAFERDAAEARRPSTLR